MSITLESAARLAALRDKADAVTGESSDTLAGAVDALIAGYGQGSGGGDELDWDDDSAVIASGIGASSNAVWEVTERGTLRWTMVNPNDTTGIAAEAGFNSSALSVIPLDYQAISPQIKQTVIGDGFLKAEIAYAPYCKRAKLPATLTSIPIVGGSGFEELDLSNIRASAISDYQFNAMQLLGKIVLPATITTLPTRAFAGCYSLREINIDHITVFGNTCFNEDFSLTGTIDFNANLSKIDAQAFWRTRVNVLKFHNAADALPTIANNSFAQCRALTDIYVPWAEGAVANAPWGATNATIHYNTTYDADGNPIV